MATTPQRIAIFGATGGTGSATLRSFLKHQDRGDGTFDLKLMVRSKPKLLRLFPGLESYTNVHIREGQLTDTKAIRECIYDANVIICALGENDNIPGNRVLQDLSKSIIDVLEDLKSSCSGEWERPRLILLSSSTWNDRLTAEMPRLILWLVKTAFYYPYLDLRLATAQLKASPELLSLFLVQPPAIVDEEPSGMIISTEPRSMAVSYSDLGDAFFEVSTKESYAQLECVGVFSKDGNGLGKYGPEVFSRIFWGMIMGYMPGYWKLRAFLKGT